MIESCCQTNVEEQAAAQTADPVEDAPKASERAVSLKSHCRLWPLPLLVQGEQLQKTALENEAPAKTATDVFGKHGGKSTPKHPCTWQELAAARRARGSAESVVEELDRVVVALWGRWRQEFQANNSAKADEIETKIDEIEAKREKAKKELEEAKKELKEAEQKYDTKASVQAGRGPGGFCVCSCCC